MQRPAAPMTRLSTTILTTISAQTSSFLARSRAWLPQPRQFHPPTESQLESGHCGISVVGVLALLTWRQHHHSNHGLHLRSTKNHTRPPGTDKLGRGCSCPGAALMNVSGTSLHPANGHSSPRVQLPHKAQTCLPSVPLQSTDVRRPKFDLPSPSGLKSVPGFAAH
ncbi:hypothetical protein N658DRAFT_181990 [Parathielavia hyrcaniae]|uniref:Uncharacterized protein n=1 Tax=Parathielavia hyrcaniae TaxID=113614 RepID=A0AAN6Q996_9PEZI|nr:hypothetical protein N658DRAFT_181990 [Parathielavia hyrcaniae]